MLRQTKPLARSPGPSTAQLSHSFLLSLAWDGGGDRYPAPQGVRRPPTPLDDMFLAAAAREPIVRPTHQSSSSETVTSASHESHPSPGPSSPSSPTRSPREPGGQWDRRDREQRGRRDREMSPLGYGTIVPDVGGYDSAMMSSPVEMGYPRQDIQHELERGHEYGHEHEQPEAGHYHLHHHEHTEHIRCPTGQHTTGLRGSIRKKLGRNVMCNRCGEVYEAKHLERRSSRIGRSLRGSLRLDNDEKEDEADL